MCSFLSFGAENLGLEMQSKYNQLKNNEFEVSATL